MGEGQAKGQREKFLGKALAGAEGDALGTTQLFQRKSFLSAGRKQLRDGVFLVLSDAILQCVTGLATTTVRDEGKDTWPEKNPGSHTFQPVNIVIEAVSAKMSNFFGRR